MRKKTNYKWFITIVLISVVVTMMFTVASTEILGSAGYVVAFAVLAVFIIIGIIFDIVGIAVTAATEAPFHSMAAHRERGATEALRLIKNANKVSSFCNDVVGDVTGIVSGSTAALIAARLMDGFSAENLLFPLLISGAVTGLTVGGKAIGKTFAFNKSTAIVLKVGKMINFLRLKTHNGNNPKR
jgi:CBS domain containing-hemolysin-like protein